jgi:hypothetical protein
MKTHMNNIRPQPLAAALGVVLLVLPVSADAQPSAAATWKASVAENGVRYLTHDTTTTLLGKPVRVSLKFQCDLTRSKAVNGTLGFELHLPAVAALAPFHFEAFEGPDAVAGDRKLMQVTIARGSRPPLSLSLAPNGWSPEGTDFAFGVAEVSHVPVSDAKTILRALADDAVSLRIAITDPQNAALKLDLTVPVAGRQADFKTLLAGLK